MKFRAWGVVCEKGNSVFLDHTRAMEYAAKHHGQVVDLSSEYVKETSNNRYSVGQTGQDDKPRTEQLSENPSFAILLCEENGTARERISTCGNCCSVSSQGETGT